MYCVLFFIRMITSVKNNSDTIQMDLSQVPVFEKIILSLEGELLERRIFQVRRTEICFALIVFLFFFKELYGTNFRRTS